MGRSITIQVSEELHEEIVRQAGGRRKISKLLVPLIKAALDMKAGEGEDMAGAIMEMRKEMGLIKERLDRLESNQGP